MDDPITIDRFTLALNQYAKYSDENNIIFAIFSYFINYLSFKRLFI